MFLQLVLIIAMNAFKMAETFLGCCNEKFTSDLLIPSGYNKFLTPLEEEGKPTYVYISLNIMDIDEIIEERMEYSLQFYVNEFWKDERLNMTFIEKYNMFQVPREWVQNLWLPDTIFENSKGGWIYPLSLPNVVILIRSFGYLHRYTRYAMKATCAMDLRYYPMDTQNCFLHISSLTYGNTKIVYKWMHEREEGNEGMKDLTIAVLKPLKYHVADMSTGSRIQYWTIGNFTILYANFTFVRQLSSHIMNVYIPSGLVVVIAFLTFWLNVKSVPARVALGLTSLLTLSTQASQSRSHLPQINYLTALDIWLFVCMILVFLSLVEYTAVYHLRNEKERKRKQGEIAINAIWAKRAHPVPSSASTKAKLQKITCKNGNGSGKDNIPSTVELEEDTELLDRISRLLFPASFFIFSLVYWIYFLKS